MDSQEEKLNELRSALNNYTPTEPQANTLASLWQTDTITWEGLQTMQIPSLTTSQITSIDLSQLTNTVLGGSGGSGGIVYTNAIGGGGGGGGTANSAMGSGQHTWTTTGTTTGYNWPNQGVMQVHAADIEINGKSVMKSLERIEEQLGILDCDAKLEEDWKELRDLGNKYRRVQKRIQDKLKTFNKLKEVTKKA